MTDKVQKIRQEIERRISNLEQLGDRKYIEKHFTEQFRFIEVYEGLIKFIDSIPEEPVKETMQGKGNYNERYKRIAQTEQFKKTYCDKSLGKEEPASEVLEEAAENYGIRQGAELKPFAIKFFKAGAKWQKQQMMKDALNCSIIIHPKDSFSNYSISAYVPPLHPASTYISNGDKVKIIIVKED